MTTKQEYDLSSYEKKLQETQLTSGQQQIYSNAQNMTPTTDGGMVREQLNLDEEHERIDNLVSGKVLVFKDGRKTWELPDDENMILFSEEGINYVRRKLSWHAHKGTLLANHTIEEIHDIVKTISISMQDAIFLKSKQFFRKPSFERCCQVLEDRLKRRKEIKIFSRKLLGLEVDESKIDEELVKEVEGRVEYELENIYRQLMKNREKEFESICVDIEMFLWNCYSRSLGGEERGSLRRHQQALEIRGGGGMPGEGKTDVKPGLISSMLRG